MNMLQPCCVQIQSVCSLCPKLSGLLAWKNGFAIKTINLPWAKTHFHLRPYGVQQYTHRCKHFVWEDQNFPYHQPVTWLHGIFFTVPIGEWTEKNMPRDISESRLLIAMKWEHLEPLHVSQQGDRGAGSALGSAYRCLW